jgi:hypothetical protein
MSMMCSKTACTAKQGMCIHEKMMVAMVIVIVAGALGHWVFHWF